MSDKPSMQLSHFAVALRSEEQSDAFFQGLIGLKKVRSFTVSEDLAADLFGVTRETSVVRYGNDHFDVEVFLIGDEVLPRHPFAHVCLQVEDREAFLTKAGESNVEIRIVPRRDGSTYYLFVRDPCGNLYEII